VTCLSKKTFNWKEQELFAELSGDFNDLHLNSHKARRFIFGGAVVHGVHILLWAIDQWIGSTERKIAVSSVKCDFTAPLPVEKECVLTVVTESKAKVAMKVSIGQRHLAIIHIVYSEWLSDVEADDVSQADVVWPRHAEYHSWDEIKDRSGNTSLEYDEVMLKQLFPSLSEVGNSRWWGGVLASTRVVGMKCPGQQSIYGGLFLTAGTSSKPTERLNYLVNKTDDRFQLVQIEVSSGDIKGQIKSFYRPLPVAQSGYVSIKKLVNSHEFEGVRALVIGGSRGLGEVTSKLLAAGGAEVTSTYNSGKEEANGIVDDIVGNGGKAQCCKLDVFHGCSQNLRKKSFNQVYYFATPRIEQGCVGDLNKDLLDNYLYFYVTALNRVFQAVSRINEPLVFFNPSTVFLNEHPANMLEYVCAKAASETLCATLEKTKPHCRVYSPRLPKMLTDQTVTLTPKDGQSAEDVMIDETRKMNRYLVEMRKYDI